MNEMGFEYLLHYKMNGPEHSIYTHIALRLQCCSLENMTWAVQFG